MIILRLIQNWDFEVLRLLQSLRTPFWDTVMPYITRLSDNGFIWILAALALLVTGRFGRGGRQAFAAGLTLAVALIIEYAGNEMILKRIFQRPRPCDLSPIADMLIARPPGFSFPSGHTAVSFAAATALYAVNKKWGLCAYALAAVIGFSRMYLYVHFPTDVIGGILSGLCFGLCGVWAGRSLNHALTHKN